MEPASKRRKLAPIAPSPRPVDPDSHGSVSSLNSHDRSHNTRVSHPQSPSHGSEFEAFARHLQDAAMMLQQRSDAPPLLPYTDVSVLLLSWESDSTVDTEAISSLQHTLQSDYRYNTTSWQIPAVSNPSIKLGVQMASFLEHARPNHLLIIYYAGRAYLGCDDHTYWADNSRHDAARLRWDGIRCMFEDAQSDILLLLDAGSAPESIPESNSRGVKQIISAHLPDPTLSSLSPAPGFFTRSLVDAFAKLRGTPFTTQRLHQELVALSRTKDNAPISPSQPSPTRAPIFFSLTPASNQTLTLAPLSRRPSTSQHHVHTKCLPPDNIDPLSISNLRYTDARVLVCTTYVGDASPDKSAFHQWLHNNNPFHGSDVSVEGMFFGPPTMLLISMPTSVWNIVQHDKVCCFLGYVTSHNLVHLYDTLVTKSPPSKPSPNANNLPSSHKTSPNNPQTTERRHDSNASDSLSSPSNRLYQSIAATSLALKADSQPHTHPQTQDSVEMQEAAEQLKALSHIHPTKRSPFKQETTCTHCSHAPFRDSSSLRKHIAAAHTRPFPCAFSFAGCSSTFGSKNEWKRHMASQHLCLQLYRCSACPTSSTSSHDGSKPNEFNRKDLFTQHLRRMHAPFQIKRSASSSGTAKSEADAALQGEWDTHVKTMQRECLVTRRLPPQKVECPKPACGSKFEGGAAWDEWTEHVGRHMERSEAADLDVDALLVEWALKEGIVEDGGTKGGYRLLAGVAGTESQSTQESLAWGRGSQSQSQPQSHLQ